MRAMLKKEKGQSMVETALVLPILLVVVIGIIDFGWLFFNKLTIANCAREGARYASAVYCDPNAYNYGGARQDDFKTAVEGRIMAMSAPEGSDVTVNGPNAIGADSYITITVECDVPLLTPMFGMFFEDNQCHMESSVTMYVEQY